MHIQTISYTRTFNLGNYSSEKIGVEFSLNVGDSANKALDHARELVEEYHAENVKRLKELNNGDSYQEDGVAEMIWREEPLTLAEKTIQFINTCKTKEELKAWELMAKSNPEILQSYNAKLETL
jgi:alkanesulfonate monooxygenase SsuD/methylene tetrahydromethanopterin reductase-like flavin-dependent oxidoreductase (luciferase family)